MLGEPAEATIRLLSGMQAKLQEQQHTRVAIHHYHCDHLGTPMALTDQTGQVAWAAKLDPWGNVLQEYNPQASTRRSGCRGSTMTGRRGCITTRAWGAM